jgi:hypothetical protein
MPWESFATMTESDIGAIYEFLHGLPPQSGPTSEASFQKRF